MSWLRRILLLVVAAAAGVMCFVVATLPPSSLALAGGGPPIGHVVSGSIHIHSVISDGLGTREDIAAAARRAGLRFVVITDHGDGRRPVAGPSYIDGVLVLTGVEISTTGGHYLALGMGQTPYPLAGEARDVVEDVRRFGGFGVAAHPGSAKPELRWRELGLPFDGLEWLNADSEWRDETGPKLGRAVLEYFFRPPQAVASLLDRPAVVLGRWDLLTRRRHVVATAGHDAHAGFGWRTGHSEVGGGAFLVRVPSYESAFRAFSVRAELADPLSGRAHDDSQAVVGAIRAGHMFTAIDAVAAPPRFEFIAQSGAAVAHEGDDLALQGPVQVRVRVNAPPEGTIVLFRDGRRVRETPGASLVYDAPARRAVYRTEIWLPQDPGRPPVPWIVSNPIYVGGVPERGTVNGDHGTERGGALGTPTTARPLLQDVWRLEKDAGSSGTLAIIETPPGGWTMTFALASGARAGQYVAAAGFDAGPLREHDRLSFTAHATRPVRVSLQLRTPDGERWQRSIYMDSAVRPYSVFFDDMRPIGPSRTQPVLANVDAILFVIDTQNAEGGMSGEVTVQDLRYER